MNRFSTFSTGNVFKLYSEIHIVTSVTDKYTNWISFSHSNVSGATPNVTYTAEEYCGCNECCPNPECEVCNGTGYYDREHKGMDQAIYLANNVKDYIISRLTKNFEF